jgi:hypothetical protein
MHRISRTVRGPTSIGFVAMALCASLTTTAWSRDFSVAIDGDDSGPGDSKHPWRTLAKANAILKPGDRVYVRAGTYRGAIRPVRLGTTEARILYAVRKGDTVVLVGEEGGDSVVNLVDRQHIVVDGFTIRGEPKATLSRFQVAMNSPDTRRCAIRNCTIINPRDPVKDLHGKKALRTVAVNMRSSKHNTFEGNHIENWFIGLRFGSDSQFNVIRNNRIQNCVQKEMVCRDNSGIITGNLIEGNLIGGDRTADGIQFDAKTENSVVNRGIVIRNNTFFNNAENAIDLKAAGDVVIEGNIIVASIGDNSGYGGVRTDDTGSTHERFGPASIIRGSHKISHNVIIRGNVFYDNLGGVHSHRNWRVYNNTFVANNRDWNGPDSRWRDPDGKPVFVATFFDGSEPGFVFLNNIVTRHRHGSIRFSTAGEAWARFDHNCYWRTPDGKPFVVFEGRKKFLRDASFLSLSDWKTMLKGQAHIIGNDARSIEVKPAFVNVSEVPIWDAKSPHRFPYDFRLAKGSACIDAGGFVTRTSSAGKGIRVVVEDARYFFDGYGIVDGDKIVIGNNPPVMVESIDYQANVIKVSREITWKKGASVSLPYTGASPDIGAFEFGSE